MGFYSQYSNPAWVEANMYARFVNSKCGIGGTGIRANLVPYEIQSDKTLLLSVIENLSVSFPTLRDIASRGGFGCYCYGSTLHERILEHAAAR